jgi:hypothetical protein
MEIPQNWQFSVNFVLLYAMASLNRYIMKLRQKIILATKEAVALLGLKKRGLYLSTTFGTGKMSIGSYI